MKHSAPGSATCGGAVPAVVAGGKRVRFAASVEVTHSHDDGGGGGGGDDECVGGDAG